jgi:hypothetical protein
MTFSLLMLLAVGRRVVLMGDGCPEREEGRLEEDEAPAA